MKLLKPQIASIALALLLAACPGQYGVNEFHFEKALIVHIYDGDTVLVRIGKREEKVRLLGIDAPEKDGPYTKAEPMWDEAEKLVERLSYNEPVTLVYGGSSRRDRYGRVLAHVVLEDGRTLNEILLKEGLARAYRKFDYTRKKNYLELEAEARRNCKGVWASGKSCSQAAG